MKRPIIIILILCLGLSVLYLTLGAESLFTSKTIAVDRRLELALLAELYEDQPKMDVIAPEIDFEAFNINLELLEIDHHVSILSVGDIMGHTLQFEAAKIEEGYDFYPQFEYISEKIQSKDFAIANLETVFAGEDRRYSGKNMIFNAPDNLGESIKKAGFDILTTANNHSLDRGFDGVKRTLETLDSLEIMHTGTARSAEESNEILTFEKNGVTFALLSYSYSTNGWPIPENHPYSINMMEEEAIVSDIHQAKEMNVDFVLVAVHWGLEYHLEANNHQRRLAERMFYEGADIILGTHPHVLQPFEHVEMVDNSGDKKDKFIIYSQGNFISGQRTYPRAVGMYINFDIVKPGKETPYVNEISVMPTYVESTYKEQQRYMRILDTHQGQSLDISHTLRQELETIEQSFIAHLSSKVDFVPYLNDENEYVLYEKE